MCNVCMACMCNVFIVLIRMCLLISMYIRSYTVHVCYVCATVHIRMCLYGV